MEERILNTKRGDYRVEYNGHDLIAISVEDEHFFYVFAPDASDEEMIDEIEYEEEYD